MRDARRLYHGLMCQLCHRSAALPRRSFLALAGAAAAVPAIAQVDVGPPSRMRTMVPAEDLEAASTQEYSKMLAQAKQQGALAPDNYPSLVKLRNIAARLIP